MRWNLFKKYSFLTSSTFFARPQLDAQEFLGRTVSLIRWSCGGAGFMVSRRWKRKDPGGDQGVTGRHGKPWFAGWGSHHGVCASSLLCPRAGRLPRFTGQCSLVTAVEIVNGLVFRIFELAYDFFLVLVFLSFQLFFDSIKISSSSVTVCFWMLYVSHHSTFISVSVIWFSFKNLVFWFCVVNSRLVMFGFGFKSRFIVNWC